MEIFLTIVASALGLALLTRTIVHVPHGKTAFVELDGKFSRSLSSGLRFIIPFVEKVRVIVPKGEQTFTLDEEKCQSADGVTFFFQCRVRWMITDAHKAVFSVTDHHLALSTAAKILLQEEVGKIKSSELETNIPAATLSLTAKLRDSALRWGIQLLGVDLKTRRDDPTT
jgi:regulator of protease activity HflC (stomatin/prohibitin superfamily)